MVFSFIGRIPLHQLFVVTLVGVTSGVYIFRPLLERYANEHGFKSKQEEHGSSTNNAAISVVDEVKNSSPEQKQEEAQPKGTVGNTSVV